MLKKYLQISYEVSFERRNLHNLRELLLSNLVLTKMRNDPKQPETTYNKQETTWNNLQQPVIIGC